MAIIAVRSKRLKTILISYNKICSTMKRLPVLSFLVLMASLASTSCEDDYYYRECTCPQGGVIGGWEEPDDTTSVNQKDTTGGFEISLENWGNSETHDIPL